MKPTVNRLLWGCRRGLLELDLVLRQFIQQYYSELSEQDAEIFMQVLGYADNDLWDLVSGRMHSADPAEQRLFVLLRQHRVALA